MCEYIFGSHIEKSTRGRERRVIVFELPQLYRKLEVSLRYMRPSFIKGEETIR